MLISSAHVPVNGQVYGMNLFMHVFVHLKNPPKVYAGKGSHVSLRISHVYSG